MLKDKRYFGDLILFLDSIIWGLGYVVVAFALRDGCGEYFLTASRFALATLLQLPFVYKKLKHLNKSVVIRGIILGLLLVSGFVTQTIGQKSTTTTNVAFLTSVNIVIIPFTSLIIIRKKLELRSIISALITFVGISFLTLSSSFTINTGDFWVIICAVLFAMYASVTDLSAKKEDTSLLVFIQFLTSAIFATIVFFVSGEKLIISKTIVWSVVYLGIFSNLVATLLYTYGLKFTSAERGSVILSLESVFGSVLGIYLFAEPFNEKLLIGTCLIMFAILYSERIIFKNNILRKTNNDTIANKD